MAFGDGNVSKVTSARKALGKGQNHNSSVFPLLLVEVTCCSPLALFPGRDTTHLFSPPSIQLLLQWPPLSPCKASSAPPFCSCQNTGQPFAVLSERQTAWQLRKRLGLGSGKTWARIQDLLFNARPSLNMFLTSDFVLLSPKWTHGRGIF